MIIKYDHHIWSSCMLISCHDLDRRTWNWDGTRTWDVGTGTGTGTMGTGPEHWDRGRDLRVFIKKVGRKKYPGKMTLYSLEKKHVFRFFPSGRAPLPCVERKY